MFVAVGDGVTGSVGVAVSVGRNVAAKLGVGVAASVVAVTDGGVRPEGDGVEGSVSGESVGPDDGGEVSAETSGVGTGDGVGVATTRGRQSFKGSATIVSMQSGILSKSPSFSAAGALTRPEPV